ncbi:MAG TPA: O-antigen ligase family protein [Steroidobacteraceae bacterium]|nr:O-antigen ligase family protein [Steroidobacteraceae bacterium]
MSQGLDRWRLPAIVLLGAVWGVSVAAGGLTAFFLCISLLACGFVLFDFRIGVVALILVMPLSGSSTLFPHEMFGITGLNPLNVLLAGTFGSYLLHALAGGGLRDFLPRPLLWLYIVPILAAGAVGSRHIHEIAATLLIYYQGLDFPDPASYLQAMVLKPLLMVLFCLLVAAAAARSARPGRFLVPAVISMCVMATAVPVYVMQSGIALHALAAADERSFLSALGLHANDLGRLYAIAYALLLFTWSGARGAWLRSALLAAAGLSAIALILTFSRGAFVALAVVNVLYVVWGRSIRTMIVAAVLVVAALALAPAAVVERLTTGEGAGLNAISAGRVNGLWLPLMPDVLRHPLFGNGIGSILWSEAMRRGAGAQVLAVTHPHNAYLEALLDTGIVGTVLLCSYFVHVWRRLRAVARESSVEPLLRGFYLGAAAGLAAMLVSDFTDSSLTPRPEQAFLWVAIGMMYGEYARRAALARAQPRAPAASAASRMSATPRGSPTPQGAA